MKCPHCNKEIDGKECPSCNEITPIGSRYCMYCGEEFEGESSNVSVPADGDGFDFENRVLCSDGTCTGIIIEGKCTECGKPL